MEITANALQTVNANQNVLFTDTIVGGSCSIVHREGSGLVSLKGLTGQCRARYRVSFGANIAIPTGGTVEAISLAIAIDGEPVATTTMIETPAAVEEFSNVFSAIFLDIPKGCCSRISVVNISEQPIDVQNANLIVERVA
jgi:hypothetical protein